MKTFIIKSDYEYKIKAKDKEEALEKWHETIADELGSMNTTLTNEFCESLYVKEVRKK